MATNSTLIKDDSNKLMLDLIEPKFILGLGQVLTFGAKKYKPNNWKRAKATDQARYKAALLRHLLAYLDGEKLDSETGLSHLHHISCNSMFLDYFDHMDSIS